MSTSTTAPTTSTTPAPSAPAKKEALPTLLPLEDDDEFEEFKAEEWDAKDSYGSSLKEKGGLDSLWEDNWDDDDVQDDFSAQLRGELLKQGEMQT